MYNELPRMEKKSHINVKNYFKIVVTSRSKVRTFEYKDGEEFELLLEVGLDM